MKDLEKVQKTLSDVFDYLKGNNLQLVGKELLTEVGDAHRIVENLAINGVRSSNNFKKTLISKEGGTFFLTDKEIELWEKNGDIKKGDILYETTTKKIY